LRLNAHNISRVHCNRRRVGATAPNAPDRDIDHGRIRLPVCERWWTVHRARAAHQSIAVRYASHERDGVADGD